MSSTAEYDAFGPWIYEIHSKEEIPRLFRSFPIDLDRALITIKVPREIERREANPSMDLYDILASLGPETITVLTRRGREFDSREVAYREVQGVTEFVDLLQGRLTIDTDAGQVVIPFNASSTEVVTHVVQVLRGKYTSDRVGKGRAPAGRGGGPAVPDVELDLQNLYRRLVREDGVDRTVGVQKRHVVTPIGASGVGRALSRAWPTTMQSAVVTLVRGREIQVLHRGKPFITGRKPVQALARTLVPIERVSGVEARPSQTHEGVSALVVRVGRVTHEFFFDTPTAERVAAELRGVVPA
jgi:hypothetical protein